jgi:hypothetical protein
MVCASTWRQRVLYISPLRQSPGRLQSHQWFLSKLSFDTEPISDCKGVDVSYEKQSEQNSQTQDGFRIRVFPFKAQLMVAQKAIAYFYFLLTRDSITYSGRERLLNIFFLPDTVKDIHVSTMHILSHGCSSGEGALLRADIMVDYR